MVARTGPPKWAERALALIIVVLCVAGGRAAADVRESDLEALEAVSSLSSLSDALWPGWDIHDTPFALYDSSGTCYLLHHPHPPIAFARLRGRTQFDAAIYRATTATAGVALGAGHVNGVPTAVVEHSQFVDDPVAVAVREAFRVNLARECSEALEPVDLITGYPVDPRHLAMADIECQLLRRAATVPADSLLYALADFVAVRTIRRVSLGQQYVEYERWLELRDGLPLYMGERARGLAAEHARGKARSRLPETQERPLDLESALARREDLDWYRTGRFACSGAGVCLLLDRLGAEWREEVQECCVDPYEVLRQLVSEPLPRATDVFARCGLEERTAQRAAFAEEAKSEGERLFESITRGPGPLLSVGTNLLSSVSVSYDRENIVHVDAHREVHTRVIKVEYSGGTHVYLSGRPVAAVLGEGELSYIQFILRAPESYTVTADGAPLELTQGIHQVQQELVVEGEGISLQARSAVVLVGEDRVTFMLQQ